MPEPTTLASVSTLTVEEDDIQEDTHQCRGYGCVCHGDVDRKTERADPVIPIADLYRVGVLR